MTLQDLLVHAERELPALVQIHRNLIAFPTVNTGAMPTGNETPCAEYLAALLDGVGCEAKVIETGERRGNLVARWRGRGDGPTLLLMSHLDVVPAGDEARWTWPPFAGRVDDGWVYGRGANDCKGLTAPEVQAMWLLAQHRVKLGGDLVLVAGADEEAGGRYGFEALAADHPEWLQADLAINEGGGAPVELPDGRPGFYIATGEKGRYEAHLTISGRSDHAATHWLSDNPLDRLGEVLARIGCYRGEVSTSGAQFDVIPRLWDRPIPEPGALDALLAEMAGQAPATVTRLRGLSRMTMVATVVSGGLKSNAVPDSCQVTVDIRTLPGQGLAEVERELRLALDGVRGLDIRVETTALANASKLTPELTNVLTGALAAAGSPDAELLPTLCNGFTDSRLVRPLGVPVFGFAPLPLGVDLERCGCHNIDEQFPTAGLLYRLKFLLALATSYCGL